MVVRCARFASTWSISREISCIATSLNASVGPVKQLQQELIGADLVERHHGGMAERGVGLIGHAAEIGVGDFAADKRPDHLDRDFPIGPAEQPGDGFGRQLRPGFGHVEAAVAGKPGQHHIAET